MFCLGRRPLYLVRVSKFSSKRLSHFPRNLRQTDKVFNIFHRKKLSVQLVATPTLSESTTKIESRQYATETQSKEHATSHVDTSGTDTKKNPVIYQSQALQDSTKAVIWALGGNILTTCTKFVAFLYTGSASMLSESLHSLADVGNQTLLLIGVHRSSRPPTPDFPYGFYSERFVWALVSALGVAFLGCGVSTYHGVTNFFHPHELEDLTVAFVVLGLSMLIEVSSFYRGLKAVLTGQKETGMGFIEYVARGPDPMGVAVMCEDGAALLGLSIAAVCISATYFTGNPRFDAVGSILIGVLLGGIATFLIRKNMTALLGRAMPKTKLEIITKILTKEASIKSFADVKTMTIGNSFRFTADVEWNSDYLARKHLDKNHEVLEEFMRNHPNLSKDQLDDLLVYFGSHLIDHLGSEVDRLECLIQKEVPEAIFVDLESK
eukprot:TRINITY_DN9259_c0_g1_i1.p1 TRINITY_DN9259_c0_g1~~TRINITY_DN9259_c0_g1_i1.p1  ORF type:complete len:435 (-),score=59.78 TRINITY_DN9259_c0_g1_i1:57-1361(-)